MANWDNKWSYEYIRDSGITGEYFMQDDMLRVSAGVKTLQERLRSIGFEAYVTIADGKFGSGTDKAVRAFQGQCKLTVDGKAGKSTLQMLDFANLTSNRPYFRLGRSRDANEWGTDFIAGTTYSQMSDLEAMARVIYAEDDVTINAEIAVALVIYNRTLNMGLFQRKNYTGSKWKSVLTKNDQQFTTTQSTNSNARAPKLGSYSTSTGCSMNQQWKNCVDMANQLELGYGPTITRPTGLAVINSGGKATTNGTNRTFTTQCYNSTKGVYEGNIPSNNARNGILFGSTYIYDRD